MEQSMIVTGTVAVLCLLAARLDKGLCLSPPTFKVSPTWPDSAYYDEDGPSIQLDCIVVNGINYTMVWTKNGDVIQPDVDQLLLLNENQTLVFEVPKQAQSGLYKCLAYNTAGNISHTGYILITARKQETRPRVIDTHPNTTISQVQTGHEVIISCTFDVGGSPEALMDLTLNWYKDDVSLTDTNHTTYGLNKTGTNDQISSLTIDKLQKEDYGVYMCYGENGKGNDSKLISVVPPVPQINKLPWPLIIGASAGGFVTLVVIIVAVFLRHRLRMNDKYEDLEWAEPEHYDVPERKIEYDVFISYSSDDLDWVKDVLFDKLCDHGYEVCIDFKDFTPGMAVAENIIDAIYKSHKTIVLMSHQFLKSMWGQFELQQAHNKTILKRTDALILIKYDDCKVPSKLIGKTFLDWSDVKVQPHFWTRLWEAIGEPGKFGDIIGDKNDDEIAKTDDGIAKTDDGTAKTVERNKIEEMIDNKNAVNLNETENTVIMGYNVEKKPEIVYDEIDEDMYDRRIGENDYINDHRVVINDKEYLVDDLVDNDQVEIDGIVNLGIDYKCDRGMIKDVNVVTNEGEETDDCVDDFQRDSVDMIDIHGKILVKLS